MSRVLVVCAHPDDEAIGCGGTIRRHVLDGDRVTTVFLTSGEAGGHGVAEAGAVREREASSAAEILGIQDLQFWRERDGRLRARRPLVQRLAAELRRIRPSLVYAPHRRDDHPDHRAAGRILSQAITLAARRVHVRYFEIWSPIEEIEDVVDISAVLEDKLRAIRAYRSQNSVMRFDEAFRGLARYRGEMHSWPDGRYAEAFAAF